ncbi:MAG: hypothetical protein LBC59_06715 [Chitinispirillales bacterium]|jgi:hypothetical protein|nr:hypothetical protein [Chitinispirillales bacterium]
MRTNNIKFMDKYNLLVSACVLAAILSVVSVCLIRGQKAAFYSTVNTSLQVSEGYDSQFIDLVNRLEDELAGRAGFGYAGQKDPMTGATRAVAERPAAGGGTRRAAVQAEAGAWTAADPVRLTAIIFDNGKNAFTAVVMNGERSYSVEVGDRVADRRVTKITTSEIYMESDNYRYVYGILGGNSRTPK